MGPELLDRVSILWDESAIPALVEYIRIPALSPHFDPEWRKSGHLERAMEHIRRWCQDRKVPGWTGEIVRLEGRTPLLFMEVAGASTETVLLYGHLDKQPPFTGWSAGLGPWTPVVREGRLYGRGGADDGYAAFAAIGALEALGREEVPHARAVILIEASEESGSPDLPAYVEHLAPRIGTPSLIVCLDSGAGDYERLWGTTSLRGIVGGTLRVDVLREGVHSGAASGIVPSSFRIARQLLSRLEDPATGRILPPELHTQVPEARARQIDATVEVLGPGVGGHFPLLPGMKAVSDDPRELLLNQTWRPALAVIGAEGMPALEEAGNVLRPYTALKLSIRIPPTVDGETATEAVRRILASDPPYGAKVTFEADATSQGWDAPPTAAWLAESAEAASQAYFGRGAAYLGEGGSIPFMAMLGERFPATQFFITGVLGPESNAHGPNEFLDIPTAKRLTACVARIVADHHRAASGG